LEAKFPEPLLNLIESGLIHAQDLGKERHVSVRGLSTGYSLAKSVELTSRARQRHRDTVPDGIVDLGIHRADRSPGYGQGAGFVITVIATSSDHAGVTAWKTSGADLRAYESQERQ
jgi:hypothetical protein